MDLWAPTSRLDRVEEQRDPAWVREVWAGGVVLDVDLDGNLACDAAGTGLAWRDPREPYDEQRHLLLGLVDGVPHFAHLSEEPGATASLRALGAHLDDTGNDLAATALALVNWHLVAPYCGVCGGPTIVRHGGDVRYCPHCERDRFPRTDPAVIVAILDPAGRLLLGHHAGWDEPRVSILAGFVSAGESLEQAVRREVREEASIELGVVRYVGSQPWPFPRSLMLGFVAEALTDDVHVDGDEIEWANFYTVDEVAEQVADGRLVLPLKLSIASRLIGAWRDGRLTVQPAPGEM